MSTQSKSDTEMLNILARRQDQHLELMVLLEGVRWKFTAALGISAFGGLLIATHDPPDKSLIWIGLILACITSLAGIVVQVRVFALAFLTRYRIRILQSWESPILKRLTEGQKPNPLIKQDTLLKAFMFVDTGIRQIPNLIFLTAGMASCFVFATIMGISASMMTNRIYDSNFPGWDWALLGISITLFMFCTAVFVTKKYMKWLQYVHPEDIVPVSKEEQDAGTERPIRQDSIGSAERGRPGSLNDNHY